MATTNPTPPDIAERRATVRRLANQGMSNRAIARQLGIHHRTVARDIDATPAPDTTEPAAPDAPNTAPQDAPPAPTCGAPPAPRLIHTLDPRLIQDLNVLIDRRTGALPAPLARAIRAAADHRRAKMRATAHRISAEEQPARRPDAAPPARVAP